MVRVTINKENHSDFQELYQQYLKRLEVEDPGRIYENIEEDGHLYQMVLFLL